MCGPIRASGAEELSRGRSATSGPGTLARVVCWEPIEARLEKARELGADETVCAGREDAIARVMDLTDGRGANAVIVAVGAPPAIELGLQCAGICGSVNLFAGTYPPATL